MPRVSVEVEPVVTDEGLKEAVAPAGRPEAVSATDWAEPLVRVVDTVAVSELPGLTEPEVGETAIEKSLVLAVQVGSPDWAGTLTAFQAAFTVLNSAQVGSRVLAACRVQTRYFRYEAPEVFSSIALYMIFSAFWMPTPVTVELLQVGLVGWPLVGFVPSATR